MAKKKKGGGDPLAQISRRLFLETAPVRGQLIGRSQDFLGGQPVTETPQFAAIKSAIDPQFQRAQQNILESTPQGGALFENLAGLEARKAGALSSAAGTLSEQELNRAFSLATGTPLTSSIGGLGTSAALQQQAGQAAAARSTAQKQGLGQAAGSIYGGSKGGPLGSSFGAGVGSGVDRAIGGK